ALDDKTGLEIQPLNLGDNIRSKILCCCSHDSYIRSYHLELGKPEQVFLPRFYEYFHQTGPVVGGGLAI
ncbi:MAG: hypothetical protein ACYTF1_17465, partial [Planctomycetota bacterium]